MKIPYLLLLTLSTNSAYALPILDNSAYQQPTAFSTTSSIVAPPAVSSYSPSNYQLADSLTKLQNEVAQLKTKVSEQSKALAALKQNQDNITARLTGSTGTSSFIPMTLATPVDSQTTTLVNEKTFYENAYAVLRNGGYDQAIAQFQSLQTLYPNSAYADNALYWIGEAYLKKGDKNSAAQTFDQLVRRYPQGGKVPDALLKQGMTQLSLNQKAKAKEYFDYLIVTYPGSPAASIAITKRAEAGLSY
jgi:tol-pal system protein YbgF